MLSAVDVLAILDRLAAAGVRCWLDGGWGVDALLGAQTRPHDDLDLVVAAAQLPALYAALSLDGYALTEDALPTRAVLRAPPDRRIDLHPVTFDAAGGGTQHLPDGASFRYPPTGFHGRGVIAGRAVACLTPEVQLLCHTGYEPDADDRHDMRALCARFGLVAPDGAWVRAFLPASPPPYSSSRIGSPASSSASVG
jgi:lincosamide nucleotidyltransferase A/C/D/E